MKRPLYFLLALLLLLPCVLCPALSGSASAQGIEALSEDNFTILWTTDPQWYSFRYPEILTHQNNWIADHYERLGVEYLIHTGDFVDLPHETVQWDFVSAEYAKLDQAGIPYGVLAGNHDVDGTDYTEFSSYFGASRYNQNAWYGGDYKNNKGHYDLLTMGEIDFLFVYMGYGTPTEEDIDWLNGVLAAHSDRIAFLMFHEFLDAQGNRTSVGDTYFEEVVLRHSNVRMVLCGHNYNAVRRSDSIDDDGDGAPDRTVYQIMANYQNTPNGGNGYVRFMECDTANGRIICRTYSPYLDDFNFFENSGTVMDIYGYQDEFTLDFDFSSPVPSDGNGKTAEDPHAAFIDPASGEKTVLPLDLVNRAITDASFVGAGVYDHTFSLNTADICSEGDVTYILAEYRDKTGYVVTDVTKGASVISEKSVVIAVRGQDVTAVKPGQLAAFSRVSNLAAPAANSHIKLYLYDAETVFSITGIGASANGFVIYDSLHGESVTADGKTALFVFAPLEEQEGVYRLTSAGTVYGEKKSEKVPTGGFILTASLSDRSETYRQSLADTFSVGVCAALSGYEPGKGMLYEGISILSKDPADWSYDSSVMIVEQAEDGALVLYNNNGLWPDGRYTLETPLVLDPETASLYYDFTVENGGKTSILLSFGNGEYVNINSCFAGAVISTNSGDIKGNGSALTGTLSFAEINLPESCYNADGTVTLNGIKIFACGTANLTTAYRELRVIPETAEAVWPAYTPASRTEEAEPSAPSESTVSDAEPDSGIPLYAIAAGIAAAVLAVLTAVLLLGRKKTK